MPPASQVAGVPLRTGLETLLDQVRPSGEEAYPTAPTWPAS